MKKLLILLSFIVCHLSFSVARPKTVQPSDREYWCSLAYKMAQPVLENMAKGELQKNMQTESQFPVMYLRDMLPNCIIYTN